MASVLPLLVDQNVILSRFSTTVDVGFLLECAVPVDPDHIVTVVTRRLCNETDHSAFT
jgi:hypothetical protein